MFTSSWNSSWILLFRKLLNISAKTKMGMTRSFLQGRKTVLFCQLVTMLTGPTWTLKHFCYPTLHLRPVSQMFMIIHVKKCLNDSNKKMKNCFIKHLFMLSLEWRADLNCMFFKQLLEERQVCSITAWPCFGVLSRRNNGAHHMRNSLTSSDLTS